MKPGLDTGAREVLTHRRVSLFCDTALAGRIEGAEAQLITRCCEAARGRTGEAGFAIPIAGGVASFAGQGSPFNKIAGLGFAGLPGQLRASRVRALDAGRSIAKIGPNGPKVCSGTAPKMRPRRKARPRYRVAVLDCVDSAFLLRCLSARSARRQCGQTGPVTHSERK